jgi:hypothetical protein
MNNYVQAGLEIVSPQRGSVIDLEGMSLDQKLEFLRSHSDWKFMQKRERLAEHESTWRSRTNGLSDLRYTTLGDVPVSGRDSARRITVDISSLCPESEFRGV